MKKILVLVALVSIFGFADIGDYKTDPSAGELMIENSL